MTAVHTAAAIGFEAAADAYARGRPDYPAALDAWLRETLGLAAGKSVVDLGAGTGKFTPRLVATGASVIAVEPVAAMRARLTQDLPNVEALDGTATAIPLPDASADAIVCAQAFHWFATREALAEIRRVLKPGGMLGLVWNVRDLRVPWVARIDAIITPYEGDTPRFLSGAWRDAFPAPGFSPLKQASFPHGHAGPAEAVVVDRQLSVSFIASLAPVERETVAAKIRRLIASEPDLAGKTEVTFPYVTRAYAARKL
jgi:SAM-dependent methyltransferase